MRKLLKSAFNLLCGALAFGASPFRVLFKNEQLVLCYHNVSSTPSEFEKAFSLCHSPETFETQVLFLKKYFKWLEPNRISEGSPGALFTFDDGYRDSIIYGSRILQKYGAFGIYFLNMGPVLGTESFVVSNAVRLGVNILEVTPEANFENVNEIEKSFEPHFISKEELKNIDEDKGLNIFWGNHLYNHYNAPALTEDQFEELYKKNELELESLNKSIKYFAYPFGQKGTCYNARTNTHVAKLGAEKVFAAHAFPKGDGSIVYRYSLSPNAISEYQIRYELIRQKMIGYILSLI